MSAKAEASTRHSGATARLQLLCLELRDFLGSAKKSIDDEIRTYPTPIPRCDAQFNYLFEQCSRLSHILARANVVSTRGDDPSELVDTLADFTASTSFTEDVLEQALRVRITSELAKPNPAINAGVTRARLRRRSGPPVT